MQPTRHPFDHVPTTANARSQKGWRTSGRLALGLIWSLAAGIAAAQGHAGEIVKVDKGQGKVTIKHGAIASLDVPAMSMAYRVKDAQWLDQLKPGDKIRFDADRVNGQFTVTRLSVGP